MGEQKSSQNKIESKFLTAAKQTENEMEFEMLQYQLISTKLYIQVDF
jgi:hypothetical protein